MIKTKISGILIGVAILSLFGAGCTKLTQQQTVTSTSDGLPEIKVGVMLPLSGEAASYGESVKKNIELAKKDLGLDSVKLVYEDSKCDSKEAVTAINKLIATDKVVAIIGEMCSGATLAAAPIAEKNQVVMISPAATSPKISDAGNYIFRTVPSDALQGDFGAKLVYKDGYRKLAVLYSNEDYGKGFESVLKTSFPTTGGSIAVSETFEKSAVDLKAQVSKIKKANPDAVYIITNSPDAMVEALKQIKVLGLKVGVYGSEGLKSQTLLDAAKSSAEGLVVTSVSVGTKGFVDRYKKEYGAEPGPFAAQGYDAMYAIGKVIKGGAVTGDKIKDELYKSDFDGASGKIKFDSKGDVGGNYYVVIVKDGKFVEVK